MIHGRGEQRKPGAQETPEQRVRRDRTVGVHLVHVDDVIQALHENQKDPHSRRYPRDDLRHPCDVRTARPGPPEETRGEGGAADDHGRKPVLGDHLACFSKFGSVRGFGIVGDIETAGEDADHDGEEGEGSDAAVPSALFFEGDGEGFEE